jgi:hypothetical protein
MTRMIVISRMGYSLYKLNKLCVPKSERLKLIREANTSKVAGHFSVGKTIANLQRYVCWPKMKEDVAWYIRGCILWCTNKPSNKKQVLYHPLFVPTRPWESISMDFMGGSPTTRKRHDYIFVVVNKFSKMCILMPCKNTIKRQEATNMFFE